MSSIKGGKRLSRKDIEELRFKIIANESKYDAALDEPSVTPW
jgi:hypothetical protein